VAGPEEIDVCAAVVVEDGCWLLAQRPAGSHLAGKWEFPGGKIQLGETPQACIRRELHEELGVLAVPLDTLHTLVHAYPEKTVRLHFIRCQLAAGTRPRALEHEAIAWVRESDLPLFDLAPADRQFVLWQSRQAAKPVAALPVG